MWRTEDGNWFAKFLSSVSSQAAARRTRRKQQIPVLATSTLAESSVEESRVSEGMALVDRASIVGLAGGSYHANLASMAQESTRRQSENAMIVCRQRRATAENPGIQEFYHALNLD